MVLPIISADERSSATRGIKGCIFGKSGIGKTSLLWTLPEGKTLFFDLEAGDLAVEGWQGDTLRPPTWQECRDFTVFIGGPNPALRDDQPYSQKHYKIVCERFGSPESLDRYDTIFVDSITVAGRLCFQWCKGEPQAFSEKSGKPDLQGTYSLHDQEMISWLTHLQCTRNKNVWFVGILDEKIDDFGRRYYQPQVEGTKTGLELPGIVDQVVTLAEVSDADHTSYRTFICQTINPYNYPAKDRSGHLDCMEEPHLGKLMDKIRQQVKLSPQYLPVHILNKQHSMDGEASDTTAEIDEMPNGNNLKLSGDEPASQSIGASELPSALVKGKLPIKAIEQYLKGDNLINKEGLVRKSKQPAYEKSIAYLHPQLSKEWDFDHNNGFKPEHFTSGSHYQAAWRCTQCNHSFKAIIKQRAGKSGSGCPKCRYIDSSYNFAKHYPLLLEEWDYGKNKAENLFPEKVAPKSTKKTWWLCKYCNSSWKAQIANRVNASRLGCPTCSRKRKYVSESYNLQTLYPAIAQQWHPTKNRTTSNQFTHKSQEKAWWLCNRCNHSWQASIQSRTAGRGCPMCAGKIVTKETSFAGKYPEYLRYWDYEKNHPLKPEEVFSKSKKRLLWKCDRNEEHTWEATVQSITNSSGCPHCGGKKRSVLPSESFEALCPDGAKMWDYENNKGKKPHEFTPQSNQKAWFRCNKHNFSWEAKIQSIYKGNRCRYCSPSIFQSRLEKTIVSQLEGLKLRVYPSHKLSNLEKDEGDIYLPDLSVIIEVDSYQWHKDKYEEDLKKSERIIHQGLILIRLRDERLSFLPGHIHCIPYNEKEAHFDICKKLIETLQKVLN